MIHTLLGVSRIIEAQGIVDYSSITAAGPVITGAVESEYREVITDLNLQLERPQWTACHLSTKAGPNAQAMVGSIVDLHLLPDALIESLGELGGPLLLERIQLLKRNYELLPWIEKFKIRNKSLIRKLSIVHDREAKERVIAIFDYWSQTALKPLHDTLMDVLRRFQGDCTYDQQSSSRWLKVPGPYYSLDLTAATDRFPVKLQEFILGQIIDPEYSRAWHHTMVQHEFKVPNSESFINYGAGQGMGAYSSWATFALCHHLTVRVAAKRAGLTASWSNYALLGDDIVLTNPLVVKNYLELLAELGVETSPTKTHVSKDTYEFAKRWYKSGVEISGFPFGGVAKESIKWFTLAQELQDGLSRWSVLPMEVETRAYVELLSKLGHRLRDLDKMRTLWSFPTIADSKEQLRDKSNWLISRFFQGTLSCNQRSIRGTFVLQTIAEIKTAMIENGLKKIAHQLFGFNQRMADLLPQGMDGQLALVALPYVEVARGYILGLQESFDSLRKAYWDLDEDIVFNKIPIRGIDPVRIENSRVSRMALLTKVSTVNKYRMWSLDYKATRIHLLNDNSPSEDEDVSSIPS